MFFKRKSEKITPPPEEKKLKYTSPDGIEVTGNHLEAKWDTAPVEPLAELIKFYGRAKDTEPSVSVPLVIIYNVKQLAAEIVKCLKDGSNNG